MGEFTQIPRTAVLGGQTRERHTFGQLSTPAVAVLAALGLVWVAAIVILKSWIVIVLGIAVGVVLVATLTRITDEGDGWTRAVLDRARFRLHAGIRLWKWDLIKAAPLWRPEVGEVPTAIGRFQEIEAPVSGGTLSLLHHSQGSNYDRGHFSAVIEVIGGGDGLRPVGEVNTFGESFGGILKSLASAEVPVTELDVESRIMPSDPAEYRDHVESLLVADPAWWRVGEREHLRASMRELAEVGAGAAETYRSFVTVRMPVDAVHRKVHGGVGTLPAVVDSATEALRVTVERFLSANYEVRNVLTPRRVAALIRNTYVPSWSVDELDGLETVSDAFAFFGYDHGPAGRSLRVEAGDRGVWWHAVATVPMDGWPTGAVGSRWLEGLVTGTSSAVIRTVKAQHQLLARRKARSRAQLALTLDEADLVGQRKKGQVSTGETEAQATSASRLLGDLLDGAAGDRPALRLLVSARSRLALEDARSVVSAAAEDINVQRLHWYDRRHDLAIVPLLPFARGLRNL